MPIPTSPHRHHTPFRPGLNRRVALSGAAGAGVLLLALGSALPANAHVTISPEQAEAGSYAILDVSVPHGCEGSATTSLSIQIPEEITAVTPTRHPLYTVESVTEQLETPTTDSHGNEVTERIAEVVYTTSTPLPDDQRDVFELSVRVPEESVGETLYYPVVQRCEDGESAWVQIPVEGQDSHELELPAPSLTVTAAGSETEEPATAEATGENAGTAQESSDDASMPLVITSLVLGGLGVVTGAVALLRGRIRP